MVNRPKSPYLSVYKAQIGSLLSIFSRISGILLTLIFLMVIIVQEIMAVYMVSLRIESVLMFLILDWSYSFLLSGILYFFILLGTYHLAFSIRYIVWFVEGGQGSRFPLVLSTHYKIAQLILGGSFIFSLYIWFNI